ncbi:MAG: flagellar hook-associated protein FlgK, partial [Lachnospiraceae bacterium]|nr:flagellar hook-associated protein FlgK [Lachnospiraceae bacterium]
MSLFSGLYVGASGLVTNQNALNTTAHNLSNIGTTGYTRQQIIQASKQYDTIGQAYVSPQQVGLGVSYADVRSVRDYFLDKAYRQESGRAEYYTTNYNTITEMETLFGELQGVAFQESFTELNRAVEELAKIPEDATNQGLLVSKAQAFLERAQAVYTGLAEYQDNMNIQIKDNIDKINEYGNKIWEINQEVVAIETGGIERANDLRDARDQLLDELSALGKISYEEGAHGIVTVQFEGVDFVTQDYVNEMGYLTGEEYNQIFAEDIEKGLKSEVDSDFYVPTWPRMKNQEVFSSTEELSADKNTDIGALKAIYNARGNTRGTYKDLYPLNRIVIDGKEYEATIDSSTGQYNQIVTPGGTYNVADDGVVTDSVSGDKIGELYAISDADSMNKFDSTTKRSTVMTVMAEFDNLIRGVVTGMNKIFSSDGSIEGETSDNLLFSRISTRSVPDGTDGWTTANLMINPTVQKTPSSLNNGFLLEDGSRDQLKADELIDLFSGKFSALNPDTGTTLTFAGYYSAIVSENATNGKVYQSIST